MDEATFNATIDQLMTGKKYRNLDIPRETFVDLLKKELVHTDKKSQAIKGVKAKLHNIVAPYLETIDYDNAKDALKDVLEKGDDEAVQSFCLDMLRAHDSTRERVPYLASFYDYIFNIVGDESSILDLACAMNPFCLPLLQTAPSMRYIAYDIHAPRVALMNDLFSGLDIRARAIKQDILVHPPTEKAAAAFLFKEAHRIEKRESGATRNLVLALNARHIFISLPTHSLNGKYDLRPRMTRLVNGIITDIADVIDIKEFPAEMIFHIRKSNG